MNTIRQNAVCVVLADDQNYYCKIPSEEELGIIESMVQVLELFPYFTDALSGEITVLIICVLYLIIS